MPEPRILLSGLGIPESPRWHGGRLWFCNWIDRQVVAADMDGTAEVMLTRDPASHSMGYSIDWLPDGRLLTTGDKVRRQEPDGSMVVHAEQRASEIVVDAGGNAYVNGADFDFVAGAPPKPGYIKLVTPDGQLRQVAGDLQFPNGMDQPGHQHHQPCRRPGAGDRPQPRRAACRRGALPRRPCPGDRGQPLPAGNKPQMPPRRVPARGDDSWRNRGHRRRAASRRGKRQPG
jgi:hypothetical protein